MYGMYKSLVLPLEETLECNSWVLGRRHQGAVARWPQSGWNAAVSSGHDRL